MDSNPTSGANVKKFVKLTVDFMTLISDHKGSFKSNKINRIYSIIL